MKKLSLPVLLASTFMITACGGDDSGTTNGEAAVGTQGQIDAITAEYHEKMKAAEPAVTPVEPEAKQEGVVVGSAEDIAAKTNEYHEKMEAVHSAHHAPVVGTAEDIAAKTKEYHEKMEALGH